MRLKLSNRELRTIGNLIQAILWLGKWMFNYIVISVLLVGVNHWIEMSFLVLMLRVALWLSIGIGVIMLFYIWLTCAYVWAVKQKHNQIE